MKTPKRSCWSALPPVRYSVQARKVPAVLKRDVSFRSVFLEHLYLIRSLQCVVTKREILALNNDVDGNVPVSTSENDLITPSVSERSVSECAVKGKLLQTATAPDKFYAAAKMVPNAHSAPGSEARALSKSRHTHP